MPSVHDASGPSTITAIITLTKAANLKWSSALAPTINKFQPETASEMAGPDPENVVGPMEEVEDCSN